MTSQILYHIYIYMTWSCLENGWTSNEHDSESHAYTKWQTKKNVFNNSWCIPIWTVFYENKNLEMNTKTQRPTL